MDREKVIKGLECCVAYDYKCNDCPYKDDGGAEDGCYSDELKADALALLKAQEPCEDAVSRKDVINVLQSPCDMRYVNGNWHPCIGDYIEAITNLSAVAPKAQEARVMTLEEVRCANEEPMWFESKGTFRGRKGFLVLSKGVSPSYVIRLFMAIGKDDTELSLAAYGKVWRCWTSRPTDEQREAIPWVTT